MPTVDRLNLGASAEIAVRDWLTVKSGRPEMARQGLENIENTPGNGMASETSNPQDPVQGQLPRHPGSRGKSDILTWTARNPLKSPESDEGIQENPSPFSWTGLDRLGFGLEEFGPRPYGVGRSLLARLSTRVAKPVAGDGAKSAWGVAR